MNIAKHKALVERTVDAFNRGDWAAADELFAADYVDHDRARAGAPPGPAGVKQAWETFRAAFPDLQATILDMVAEGDRVAVRGVIRGTQRGELMGIPPTGKPVTVTLIDVDRIEAGKLVERWAETDTLGMLQQLGVIPVPEPAGAAASGGSPATAAASRPGVSASLADTGANKALVRRFIDAVINRGDLAAIDELVATSYVYRGPGLEVSGAEGIRGVFAMLRSAFPDWHEDVEDLIAEGDKVVFRVTGHGTHRGAFFGVPPTGKDVNLPGIDIVRIEGGTLTEHWANFDQLGLMQQLGAMPAPVQPGT